MTENNRQKTPKPRNTLKLTYDSLIKHVRKRKNHNFLGSQTTTDAKLPVKSVTVWTMQKRKHSAYTFYKII